MELRKALLAGGLAYLALVALLMVVVSARREQRRLLSSETTTAQAAIPTQSNPGGISRLSTITRQPAFVPLPTRTPSQTPTLPPSETPAPTETGRPTPTATITPTPTPLPGRIRGRVLVDGIAVVGEVSLALEDSRGVQVREIEVNNRGIYRFESLPPSSQGYTLVFAQEENTRFDMDEVVSWAWLGPIPVGAGAAVQLPDLELSHQGFIQSQPEAEASLPVGDISAASPLVFAWLAYPGAEVYWVDLLLGEEQTPVWQSPLVSATSVAFDGFGDNGIPVHPGDYWWGIGAQLPLEDYTLTVYSYLAALALVP